MNTLKDIFGEVISTYTRKEAIEDGFLFEVRENILKEAGIKFNTCISAGINAIIEDAIKKSEGMNDFEGIIWDILTMLKYGIKRSTDPERVNFIVKIWKSNITMYAVCGGGDKGEPVITIMLPNED
jgi:type I site-specific restriction-modification system R (restriction) subunit